MEIKTKFKKGQKVWCNWLTWEEEYVPRKATIIEFDEKETSIHKQNIYKLHYDNSKIDFLTSKDFIYFTEAEAQAECDKRNKGE